MLDDLLALFPRLHASEANTWKEGSAETGTRLVRLSTVSCSGRSRLTLGETLLVAQDPGGDHLAVLGEEALQVGLLEVWRQIGNV